MLGQAPVPFELTQAKQCLPLRGAAAHKKQARLLVVAGSSDYLGAALLCARAAYRSGAGMVRLALPQALAATAVSALPEAVVLALPQALSATSASKPER